MLGFVVVIAAVVVVVVVVVVVYFFILREIETAQVGEGQREMRQRIPRSLHAANTET